MTVFKAQSPAKLILSGEHAVVYGHPALAVAVNRYSQCELSPHVFPNILFHFLNLNYVHTFTIHALNMLKHRLQEQYEVFLEGHCSIKEVLKNPFELLAFTLGNVLEKWLGHNSKGFEIRASSNIPMGCGMGSSAASIMSLLMVLGKFFNLKIDPFNLLKLGKESENLQHGQSSGLDLWTSLTGGYLKFKEGRVEKKKNLCRAFTLVQTGKPETSTGECVTEVAQHFKTSSIGKEFEAVTEAMDKALSQKNEDGIHMAILENHRLLKKIGVVPEKVAAFIQAIEHRSGSAKICGSGAVRGEAAGMVWVNCSEAIDDLLAEFDYEVQQWDEDEHGTRLL